MRIQHNIMAMNAYRNYTNNTSALAKNLEKLSSGYRINRAGDDAAGLAISEKMRAQITALGTAQKNVKDGISLVKTAEGATQEVHDMLNRMVDLATQSANGTYQNEVDREAIQSEYEALKTEINRIADSSNFNGIKLLNGDLDAGGETTKVKGQFQVQATGVTVKDGNIGLPKVGETLGTDTVLHKEPATAVEKNEFSVELHNLEFTNANGKKLNITIGDATFELTGDDSGKLDAAAIAESFVGATGWSGGNIAAGKATINGVEYDVTADGNKLVFSTEDDVDSIPATVEIKDPDSVEVAAVADQFKVASLTQTGTTGGDNITVTVSYTDANGDAKTKDVTFATGANGNASTAALVAALNADTDLKDLFTAAGTTAADGITLTSKTAGANLKVTGLAVKVDGANDQIAFGTASHPTAGADAYTPAGNVTGDYNVSTTDIQAKAAAGDKRLASTHFTLTDAMVKDGSSITIGTKTYTFTTDKSKIGTEGYVDVTDGDLAKISERLTDAVAANNTTYTLGTDTTAGHITITEKDGQKDFDLSSMGGIEKSLGFTKAVTSEAKEGGGLTLQIGEDSASYNQLNVSIKDMHTSSLGLDAVNLDTQTNAQDAVSVIKDAINYVSTVRSKLGATQNRLEHTQNNLSTMKENIQDAEATIRDTDIAEEMMAYTKNNILVQSAQAMLAQANQIPQGVLQLLG